VVDNEAYLEVTVVCLDSPLVIKNILKGLEVYGGPSPPPPGSNGCPTKIMSTSLGIYVCIFTRSIPLGVYGLDLIPIMVWAGVVVNGASITVTME
jgi:hypothetical protein